MMDSTLMTNIFFSVIASVLICVLHYIRNRRKPAPPPGPINLPVVGYLPFIDPANPQGTLFRLAYRYGSIYSLKLGKVNVVVLTDVGLIREFLRREEFTARAPLYITHGIMGGYGLICSEGPLWKDQRRQSIDWLKQLGMTKAPTDSRDHLEGRIRNAVYKCLETLRAKNTEDASKINLSRYLYHSLGNFINDLVFGITYEEDNETWKYLQELQEEGVKLIGISGGMNFLPFLRFIPSNQRVIDFLLTGKRKTHDIYDKIIANCMEKLKQRPAEERNTSILQYFLQRREHFLQSENPTEQNIGKTFYSDIQLRHLLADMFGAGLDTTLTTMRWFFLYMAKYPEYQKTLHSHLKRIKVTELTYSNLEACDYLKACISEVQRIRTVVPLGIPHGTNRDTVIADFLIKKNTMVLPFLWGVHMNPYIWTYPDEYRPERFLEDGRYTQRPEFIPFQTGKRMCLGSELAKMILTMYAGILLRHFEVTLSEESKDVTMEGVCGITLSPHEHTFSIKWIQRN